VALAIVDDLGAILTMVLFYSTAIDWQAVAAAGACLAFLVACNRLRLFAPLPYIVGGLGLWLAMLKSGIHPTLAGVLLAVTLPAQPKIKQEQFRTEALAMLGADASGHLTYAGPEEGSLDTERLPRYLENLSNQAQSPMDAWEQRLHPWVTYGIMPLFALANVGMAVSTDRLLATLQDQLGLAIILGLVLGKQLGITGASLLAIRLGWAEKPARATWRHLYGASWLGGIGFTMSLFITHLAFNDPAHVQTAKMAILLAALFAVLGGCLILSFPKPEAAR
jgi:NhaA family Na+:H+ antiporter